MQARVAELHACWHAMDLDGYKMACFVSSRLALTDDLCVPTSSASEASIGLCDECDISIIVV